MSGRPFIVVVAISLAGLLLPGTVAASEHRRSFRRSCLRPCATCPRRLVDRDRRRDRNGATRRLRPGSGDVVDPVVQTSTTTAAAAQALGQWEGLGAGYPGFTVTAVPPDPNMAVGPNHIVQWVNNAFVVFDKSGAPIIAPVSDDTFWGGLSTCNQLGGFSDPIVQYDRVADRWIVGEVAIPLLPRSSWPIRSVLRGLHHVRSNRLLLHVGLRIRHDRSRLSEDRGVAGRLLRDLEHLCRTASPSLEPRRARGTAETAERRRRSEVRVLRALECSREPLAFGSRRIDLASGRFSEFPREHRSGFGRVEPLEVPRRLREPGELDLHRADRDCGRGSVYRAVPRQRETAFRSPERRWASMRSATA